MELAILKNKIKKNKNILKIMTSLKIMCFTRLKNLKILNNNMTKNISEIKNNIINKIQSQNTDHNDYFKLKKETNIEESNENTSNVIINIFLFTDMSFCGNFNDNNKNIIVNMKKNFNNNANYQYHYIIGSKGEKYTDPHIEYISKLYNKNLNEILKEKLMKKIEDHFEKKIQITIFSYNNKKEIINLNSLNLYENFYENYLLKKTIVEFKYEECCLRFAKVTTAIKNTEDLQKTLETVYNKKRQEIITKDLLEVMCGSQVENIS
jgi:F0F1-type ATP synthase gamma subunit